MLRKKTKCNSQNKNSKNLYRNSVHGEKVLLEFPIVNTNFTPSPFVSFPLIAQ